MGMQVSPVRRVTEIYLALLASPAIFRPIAVAGFAKAVAVFVDRRSIVSVQRHDGNQVSPVSGEILAQTEVSIDLCSLFSARAPVTSV